MTVLHLTHTDINNDSRILKEIGSLRTRGFVVDGLGVLEREPEGQALITSEYPALSLYSRKLYFLPKRVRHFFTMIELMFRMLRFARGKGYRIIHCHDTLVLPIGLVLKCFSNITLIYDAHELESDRNGIGGGDFLSWLILCTEKFCWSRIDHLIVVSDSIGRWYCEHISQKDYTVILNSPVFDRSKLSEEKQYLRKKFMIPEEKKVFVYIGILGPGRGIDLLLEAFNDPSVEDHLVFIGFGEFEIKVLEMSKKTNNIHLHPRVSHDLVVPVAASADFGICLIENVSLSDYYCLPNKLFEYLFAGLPVISSDFPEISALLKSLSCGRTSDLNVDSLIRAVNEISSSEAIYVNRDSMQEFSWIAQEQKLGVLYNKF